METNELLTSLSRLESTLQEVESAKNQVKQTVNAYDILQKKISEYTKSLDSIKTSIQGVVSDLRSQRASLGEEATSIASSLHAEAEHLFNKLSEDTTSVLNTLKAELTAINGQFASDSKAVADGFKNSTDEQLTKLQQSVRALKECTTTLEGLQTSIKDTLSEITLMKQGIAELKQSLESSQSAQDTLLSEIKSGINSLSDSLGSLKTAQDNAFNKVDSLIKTNSEKIDTFVARIVKGQNLNLFIGIVNLLLIISIGLLIFLK